jgi:hypothetical protein
MILKRKATPQRVDTVAGRLADLLRAVLGALFLGLLFACGGSTSQYDPFIPGRLLVFGDDDSSLTTVGRNYGVNGLDASGNLDCTKSPIWVQGLAGIYGFAFAECNPGFVQFPQARMLAYAGAKVADVAAQVEAQVAAGGFRTNDLATVLAGANDIYELYGKFPSLDEPSLIADARARGKRLAQVVNRLVDLGAKVIVSDLPDLALTPLATKQRALGIDTSILTRLTVAFNEQLGVNVLLDGRYVGLMQTQLRFQALSRSPGGFGITNISDGICTAPVPDCSTNTLLPDAAVGAYLWADDTHLAPSGQSQLATLAVDRARRNPF